MGEYAKFRGESIKIGTCEDMYYLRADQRGMVQGYDFASCLDELRFRFPFPDEDELEPGNFDDYSRGERIPGGWTLPADYTHDGTVQFTSQIGYVLSIQCPESFDDRPGFGPVDVNGVKVHRNGWRGGYVVRQLKHVGDEWWTVVACSACGCAWRLPAAEAESVAVAFRSEADRQDCPSAYSREWGNANTDDRIAFLHTMADRIMAGYSTAVEAI
jgi:hypothetical protein